MKRIINAIHNMATTLGITALAAVIGFACTALFLTGCVSPTPPSQTSSGQQHQEPYVPQQQQPSAQPQQQPAPVTPATAPQPQPQSLYYTGTGGRGMRLGIFLPQSRGLSEEQEYLPAMVQGVLVSNIAKYSAITVLDRVSLDRVIAETLDPTFGDSLDVVRLGAVAQVSHMMTGSIVRAGANYVLQIHVTDTTQNAATLASYSGTCTEAELNDHTAIHRAALELLSQMNVQLTAQSRNELSRPSAPAVITAQTALAQGITAQSHGSDDAALTFFQEAAAADPSLDEAETRRDDLISSIASGASAPAPVMQAVTVNYTVRFDANGGNGTAPAPMTVPVGGSVTLPGAVGLTKPGDRFNGWNLSETGGDTGFAAASSYRPTRNITLYAAWEPQNAVPGANFAAQLGWVRDNVQSGGVYTLRLRNNESIGPQNLSFGDIA